MYRIFHGISNPLTFEEDYSGSDADEDDGTLTSELLLRLPIYENPTSQRSLLAYCQRNLKS
jgi:hypothetical protein